LGIGVAYFRSHRCDELFQSNIVRSTLFPLLADYPATCFRLPEIGACLSPGRRPQPSCGLSTLQGRASVLLSSCLDRYDHLFYENTEEVRYRRSVPVGSSPAGAHSLSEIAANAWGWCADRYGHDYSEALAAGLQTVRNPLGPDGSNDPDEPATAQRAMHGRLYRCSNQHRSVCEVWGARSGRPEYRLLRTGGLPWAFCCGQCSV
jgi:hypothetical protein